MVSSQVFGVSVKVAAFCTFICDCNYPKIMRSVIESKLSLYVDDLLLYCVLRKSIFTLYEVVCWLSNENLQQ